MNYGLCQQSCTEYLASFIYLFTFPYRFVEQSVQMSVYPKTSNSMLNIEWQSEYSLSSSQDQVGF